MNHLRSKLSVLIVSSAFYSLSYGAGFAIKEQSVTGLGRAFAGSAAVADDASTLFFNPAGLTNLSASELAIGLHYISPQTNFNDGGSTAVGGAPLTGSNGGDAGEDATVPNLFYAHRINDRMVAGIGVTAPFGLATDYGNDWQGRYHAIRSELLTINVNPSFAFKANDKLSIGFGLSVQYIDLELSQAVDFGTICAGAGEAACTSPQGNDGKVKLNADDWGFGYNFGTTYQATKATRLGLAYRSKISHTLEGEGKFRVPTNAQGVANAIGFVDGNIAGDVDLPESASLAIHHQLNNKVAIMADATWTRWGRFQELAISSKDVSTLNSTKQEQWSNAMRYALGVDYQYDHQWTFRGGVAYDETPTSDQFRTARIADEDRIWLAIGASYQVSDRLTIDAGYTHIFIDDPKIDETLDLPLNQRLRGQYEGSVDILSVQARWLFQ
ncbi:MAG: long-chain fatty acid transport protein [Methylophagaceae bacterium]|jgi:long-chain fatty acid transport protein